MSAPRVGVLGLQGDVSEHLAALRSVGAQPCVVRHDRELSDLDGIVLPGGESTTMALLLERFELFAPLQAALRAGLPAYGSCAGMILLADEVLDGRPGQPTLGGLDVVVRRNAFGRQVDSFETDLDVRGIGSVHAAFIRAPWVESAGEGVQVLATCPEGSPAAGRVVAVRSGALLATSFHPEITGDNRVHLAFVEMVKERRR